MHVYLGFLACVEGCKDIIYEPFDMAHKLEIRLSNHVRGNLKRKLSTKKLPMLVSAVVHK